MLSMLPNEILTDGFCLWLEEFKGRYRPVIPPDPFATSLRSTAPVFAWLQRIDEGIPIESSPRRRQQGVTDMKANMGLVSGPRDDPQLTAFGRAVLARWQELGLDKPSDAHEIARCAALIRAGLNWNDPEIHGKYWLKYASWERLAQLPSPGYWLQGDLHRLFLPYFLANEDSRGYTPFTIFVALSGGRIGETDDWVAWASGDWEGATNLKDMLDYIRGTYRLGGSLNFRRALEAVRAARHTDESFPRLLEEWGIAS